MHVNTMDNDLISLIRKRLGKDAFEKSSMTVIKGIVLDIFCKEKFYHNQ